MSQTQPSYATRSIYHGWLPQHPEIRHAFLDKHVNGTRPSNGMFEELKDPHVKAFIKAIKNNNVMQFLSNAMFKQVEIYTKNPKWKEVSHQVDSLDHLGAILDSIFETGPTFWKLRNSEGKVIGEPVIDILAAFDLLSNTPAAYDLFRMKDFNGEMKKLLDGWAIDTLQQEKSASVFKDENEGWFCKEGLETLERGLKGATFDETFDHDPNFPPPRRYKTWDSFFTRTFKKTNPPLRPVEVLKCRGQDVPVINNACESVCLRVAHNVQFQDRFWLKGQNYSLYDMFGSLGAEHAKGFEGGTVYQAFLSRGDYHRWHSPVKGKVVASAKIGGTYFAVLPDEGSPGDDGLQKGDPHGAMFRCQPWLSVSAARYIFIIEPDDEEIAKVAFIGIGMAAVSSVEPRKDLENIKNPVLVNAGEELGMFRFGGSSYVVIVKLKNPDKKQLVFKDINDVPVIPGQHCWVNSIIARVEDIPKDARWWWF